MPQTAPVAWRLIALIALADFALLIARAATWLFGATPTGLRMPSALALAGCVVLGALTAREFGGGRRGYGVDNEEQGTPLAVCAGPRAPWPAIWPRLHHLDA